MENKVAEAEVEPIHAEIELENELHRQLGPGPICSQAQEPVGRPGRDNVSLAVTSKFILPSCPD